MDLNAFKLKYLKDKPKRKLLVSEFKPTMIRVLHKVTEDREIKHGRSFSATRPSRSSYRPLSYKKNSGRLNSGRSTINTTWYNTFQHQTKSVNLFEF
jgi:hypothetical protein